MKQKIMTYLIVIFASLMISSNFLYSAPKPSINCPQGFVHLVKYVMVNINGTLCQYRVDLCVKCPAGTNQSQFIVELASFEPYPINCGFDPSQVKDEIINIVTNPDWITQNIGTDCFAGWGPCPENAVTVIGVTPLCWKKIKYEDDDHSVKIIYAACYEEGCTCQQDKIICWNGTSFDIIVSNYYRNPTGCISPCENIEEPDDNTIPDPTLENPFPESVCFGQESPCK